MEIENDIRTFPCEMRCYRRRQRKNHTVTWTDIDNHKDKSRFKINLRDVLLIAVISRVDN